MQKSFFDRHEIESLGFRSVGENVLISRFVRIYNPQEMEIGNDVRIDDYCILSGQIKLHNYIHISAFCALYGKYGIEMEDYTGTSPRCTIFSMSDDFSGDFLIGPMSKKEFTNVIGGKVLLKKYSHLGANCVVLPNSVLEEGAVTGAMSLVKGILAPWTINTGIPARHKKQRRKELLNFIQASFSSDFFLGSQI